MYTVFTLYRDPVSFLFHVSRDIKVRFIRLVTWSFLLIFNIIHIIMALLILLYIFLIVGCSWFLNLYYKTIIIFNKQRHIKNVCDEEEGV